MTTFLEFVCERLMGPPARCRGNGESGWPCPRCDHHSFHTLPHVPDEKDRFKCFRCDFWGDEYDLLAHFGIKPYSERVKRVAELQAEYEASGEGVTIPFQGAGTIHDQQLDSLRWLMEVQNRVYPKIAVAWAEMSDADRELAVAAYRLMRRVTCNADLPDDAERSCFFMLMAEHGVGVETSKKEQQFWDEAMARRAKNRRA